MLSPSEFNNAVPKFTNGNYANNPVDPQYIEEPTLQDYNRGVEPLETLPAQWWNWLCNQFTSRFNKINTYVKNIFDEITQLLSLLNISPDGTESAITTGQLKNFFKELYPTYVSDKLELGTTYVPQTRTVNGHALTGNITITKSDVGLGNVDNTSDADKPVSTAQATAISTAINALDVASVGGSGKYLSAISETDGKISAIAGDIDSAVTANSNNLITSGGVANAISSVENVIYDSSITDCNIVYETGKTKTWWISDTASNIPNSNSNWYIFAQCNPVSVSSIGRYVTQIATTGDGSPVIEMYIRHAYISDNNMVWTAWEKLISENDVTNQVTNGDSAPVSSGAVADILSSLPTDAVLHYSFDDLPDLPDGTAVYKKDNNWTSDDNWHSDNENTTFSASNGVAKWTSTNTETVQLAKDIDSIPGKVFIVKFKCSKTNVTCLAAGIDSGTYPIITQIVYTGGWAILTGFIPSSYLSRLILQFYLNETGASVEISQIYIGDGSYSTPVIDNANGQNNATNNGGIAVQGVSGKGIQFLQNSNAYIYSNSKPLDGLNSWTISFWLNLNKGVKATSQNPRLYMFGPLEYCYIDDFYIGGSGSNADFVTFKDNEHQISVRMNMSQYIGQTIFVTVETEIDTESTSTKRVYVNGVLKSQGTGSIIEKPTYSSWSIGGTDGKLHLENSMIDDFQIFDRALTEKEVVALYNNKANTPKYYNLNNYKIDNANVAEEGGTGKYIESIKQEGGLIVPVEQTIDTAPSRASTKPITSGAMYSFFDGSKTAYSWLGKALGHLLGKTWSYCRFEVSNKNFNSITYGNGTWVACENNFDIWWSYDGEEWIYGGTTTGSNSSVCYGNGIFVASCNGSTTGLWWSEDGKTWNPSGSGYGKFIKKVFYGNNMWIACTSNGDGIYWSTDGKTWTKGTGSNASYSFNYAHYAAGLWVAGSADSNGIWWSSDGKAWTKGTGDGSRATVSSIYYANNLWVVSNNYTTVSSDGKNWSQVATNIGNTCAYYANGMWIATRTTGLMYNLQAVSDSWTEISNAPSITFNFVTYANGIWIAGGTQLWWSYDGFNWVPAGGISTVQYNYNFKCIKYANGTWVVGSDNGHGLLYSNISNVELTK